MALQLGMAAGICSASDHESGGAAAQAVLDAYRLLQERPRIDWGAVDGELLSIIAKSGMDGVTEQPILSELRTLLRKVSGE